LPTTLDLEHFVEAATHPAAPPPIIALGGGVTLAGVLNLLPRQRNSRVLALPGFRLCAALALASRSAGDSPTIDRPT